MLPLLSADRPFNMVPPPELNPQGSEEDIPDGITPRPLNEVFASMDMPPPIIQLVPLVLKSIWDSDMMTKYTDDWTGQKKWQEWFENNATGALGHVVGIVKDAKACRGMIPPCYKEAYLNFYCSKYDTKAFKHQSFAMLSISLKTMGQRTIASD